MSNVITMNTKTETFYFQNMPIRVVRLDGEPWFVVADVCKALDIINPTMGLKNLDKKEKAKKSLGSGSPANIISESGLYKLILRSNKSGARPFQDWVTQVVLPTIRKDGGYIKDEEKVATSDMSEDEFIFKAMSMLKNKAERLEAVVEEHLKHLTVNEWAALNHLYISKGQRVRMGEAASYLCRNAGFEPGKQQQHITNFSGGLNISVGIYPKHILDDAALLVGIDNKLSLNLGGVA